MIDTVHIDKINESKIKLTADRGVLQEISDAFTFKVKGAEFQPAYKNRLWDGKIRLLDLRTNIIHTGLTNKIVEFCNSRGYEVTRSHGLSSVEFSLAEAKEFVDGLDLPANLEKRDYQIKAFAQVVRDKRGVLLSPTASGKSLIMYMLTRYYNANKTLIVVPGLHLSHQLESDFRSYGYTGDIHKIYSGQEKTSSAKITITTWQSAYKLEKSWFKDYQVMIGDEAHNFAAKSLIKIMDNMTDVEHRFGLSGTLDGTQVHELVLEGLFGPVRKVVSTKELMDQGYVSQLKIKCLVLEYSDEEKKKAKDFTYQDEMDFIVTNPSRNRFIKNLAKSLKGNTLILFQYVDKHGKVLHDILKDELEDVHFIHGDVEGEEREDIRQIVMKSDSSTIIASYGTYSPGVNIPNIHTIIFASPSKSRIRNLQSIGRGLRKAEGKSHATLYDLSDDLSWKSKRNHTLNHFAERVKIYTEESFDYKIYNVELK